MYKDLHAHLELSFHESKTAAVVASKLKELGYEVLEGIGRTGVVGILRNGDLFLGRTDDVVIRFAAAVALLFNVLIVIIALIAIAMTVPKDDPRADTPPVLAIS